MSSAEIVYRLWQRVIKEVDRLIWVRNRCHSRAWDTTAVFQKFKSEQDVHFFFRADDREALATTIHRYFSDGYSATVARADALCQHQIEIFGRTFALDDEIDWHRDPLTERSWPQIFAGSIDTRDGKTIGGVKWVWELNRHHHLVTLGKAYFLTGDERYAAEVCAQLQSWIAANPPLTGVNWTSTLELGLRLINWSWTLAFIRCSSALTPDLFGVLLQSINAQAKYIRRHLSAFSSANNHLIGEAAGLVFSGFCFPQLPHARQWREEGLHILEREITLQIYEDGVPAEQSPDYLSFVLDFNLYSWRLAALNGIDIPVSWSTRLEAATEFLQYIMDSEGNVPSLGDSDDAWVVRLDDRPQVNNYRSILATAAVLCKRSDLKASADAWDEKSHWLLGPSGQAIFAELPPVKFRPDSYLFRQGGYAVMRAESRLIVFDCGPLGYLSTAAHGHADALSLTVSVSGRFLLIDPGTYAYQEGGACRDYFRSTVAHNTVTVDNQNQSEIQGAFLWGRKAQTKILDWQSTEKYDFAVATHDGYADKGVIHRRAVWFHKPELLLVVDWLEGSGVHHVAQRWRVPSDTSAALRSDFVQLRTHGIKWRLVPITVDGCKLLVREASGSPPQGWVSTHYGQKEAAPIVTIEGQLTLPARLVTAIYLADTLEKDALSAQISHEFGKLERILGERFN